MYKKDATILKALKQKPLPFEDVRQIVGSRGAVRGCCSRGYILNRFHSDGIARITITELGLDELKEYAKNEKK